MVAAMHTAVGFVSITESATKNTTESATKSTANVSDITVTEREAAVDG